MNSISYKKGIARMKCSPYLSHLHPFRNRITKETQAFGLGSSLIDRIQFIDLK